jgi:hypothetical protein
MTDILESLLEPDSTPIDKLSDLSFLCQEHERVSHEIEAREIELKGLKAKLNEIENRQIPELMDEMSIETITVSGRKVGVKTDVYGSLPSEEKSPDKHRKAIDWLLQHEAGGLIKTTVIVEFPATERRRAIDLKQRLISCNLPADVSFKERVHPQSLCAWGRERLRNGETLAADVIGLAIIRKATIK